MNTRAYEFPEGLGVISWDAVKKQGAFDLFEMACLSYGQSPELCRSFISRVGADNRVDRVKAIIKTIEDDLMAFIKADKAEAGILKEEEEFKDDYSPFVRVRTSYKYTRESIKAFYEKYLPNEKPYYLFPEENAVNRSLVEQQALEIRSLRQEIKGLSKLVIAFLTDGYSCNINPRLPLKGMGAFVSILEEVEQKHNKDKSKEEHIALTMTQNTMKKYINLAYKNVKVHCDE